MDWPAWIGASTGTIALIMQGFSVWQRSRKKPNLTLDLEPSAILEIPPILHVAGKACAFLRLEVENRGQAAAEEVSVVLRSIENVRGSEAANWRALAGDHLAWSGRQPTNPHAEPESLTLGPGVSKLVDLVHLNVAVPEKLILDLRPQPTDKRNYMGEVEATFVIEISAKNSKARRYEIDLAHHGERWSGRAEDVRSHVTLGEIRRRTA